MFAKNKNRYIVLSSRDIFDKLTSVIKSLNYYLGYETRALSFSFINSFSYVNKPVKYNRAINEFYNPDFILRCPLDLAALQLGNPSIYQTFRLLWIFVYC